MDKDAYYFPHFCNARHDRKVKRIIKELGVEGYGIFFMLLEVLREQADFKYPLDDIDLLADEFRTSEQKVRTVICNYQLFNVDEQQKFFSPKLMIYLQPYFAMKEQRRIAGLKSGEARRIKALTTIEVNGRSTDEERELNGDEQSKVKKSKVKKSKVNIESSAADIKSIYLNNINMMAPQMEIEQILDWQNDLPDDVILLAIQKAIDNKKRSKAYIESILRNWLNEGLLTVEAIAEAEKKRQLSKQPRQEEPKAQQFIDGDELYNAVKRAREAKNV